MIDMSSEWKKILREAEQLYSDKISTDPTYRGARHSSESAIVAIKNAIKKVEIAESGSVIEDWQSEDACEIYGKLYGLAKIIAGYFQIEEPFRIKNFEKIPQGGLSQYVKYKNVGTSGALLAFDEIDLRDKLNRLFYKGFLAKRKVLAESGRSQLEYKVTQHGYDILQKQEKMRKGIEK
jgi:hypothetical protein